MNKGVTAKAEMLIRKPVGQVFEAFVDPAITSKFWFTRGSGRLKTGRRIIWEWQMYGVSSLVKVKTVSKNRRILIEWDGYSGPEAVEWNFTSLGKKGTFVAVKNWGFRGSQGEIMKQALDSTGGFTWLLAGAKAFLEHGIQLNLVADAHPEGVNARNQG